MPAVAPNRPSWSQVEKVVTDKVIIDTDIGDDVDDAFALALAVKSPELQILGITTARLASRPELPSSRQTAQ